ncbi:MAG: glycosyltransferase family 2 protein, partial [Planctomycetaceae bacterium]|nr:glycosyltransferase family 2 protein [Planctomycetaceae bacterium]
PVFNEEGNVSAFAEIVSAELSKITDLWEIIFVDDGSVDQSLEILKELRIKDSRIKIVRLARNFGNQAAISAGLKYSQGNAVIIMDSDLQHPPELIAEMFRLWKDEGYHSVYTIREYGKDVGIIKRYTSAAFGKLLNYFSNLSMPDRISDFRLLDRRIVNYINSMEECSRFLRAMITWLGFRQTGIHFKTQPRFSGATKFSPLKLLKLSVDGITSFSVSPLHWIVYFGISVALMSLFYSGYIFLEVLATGNNTPGWPTLIVAILFLGGVQIISIGVVGEYVGRIYMETKRRPLFVVQEKYGFDIEDKENRLENFLNKNNNTGQIKIV